MALYCHHPDCAWLQLKNLSDFSDAPALVANPEVSGIGVILGFSITAYLTLILLIVNYIFAFNPERTGPGGRRHANPLDCKLLAFVRCGFKWRPSRRLENALDKSVLLLSDAQLVTGLAILASGYSQLHCGISAYHWQMMVYVAWFSSLTFLAAVVFLQQYFQENPSLRIIRVCFMAILSTMLVVALLPTGSRNWLDLANNDGGFYPSLNAICYFKQLSMPSFGHGNKNTKISSMVFSALVIGISYLSAGMKLFDPTSALSRKYIRTWPGSHIKRLLHNLDQRSQIKGTRAGIFGLFYLLVFAAFAAARACFDMLESMLFEIIWLTFAIAWGTIKLFTTRSSARYNSVSQDVGANPDVLSEDTWTFGQTLPLILLLLPILSMAQVYLDNDTRALDDSRSCYSSQWMPDDSTRIPNQPSTSLIPAKLSSIQIGHSASTAVDSPPIFRCPHHRSCPSSPIQSETLIETKPPHHQSRPPSPTMTDIQSFSISSFVPSPLPSSIPPHSISPSSVPSLPRYPFTSDFYACPWYLDLLVLIFLEVALLGSFVLYLLNAVSAFLGVSILLRSRVFLLWIFAVIPSALFLHLAFWWVGAWAWYLIKCRLREIERRRVEDGEGERSKRWDVAGKLIYWSLRIVLVSGLVVYTLLITFEIGGPNALAFS